MTNIYNVTKAMEERKKAYESLSKEEKYKIYIKCIKDGLIESEIKRKQKKKEKKLKKEQEEQRIKAEKERLEREEYHEFDADSCRPETW